MNLIVIMRVTWSNCDEKNDIERCLTYIEQSHYCRALIQDQYMNKKLMYTGLISSRRCSRKKKKRSHHEGGDGCRNKEGERYERKKERIRL